MKKNHKVRPQYLDLAMHDSVSDVGSSVECTQ